MKKRPDISGIRSLVSICGCASILIHLALYARGCTTTLIHFKGNGRNRSLFDAPNAYPFGFFAAIQFAVFPIERELVAREIAEDFTILVSLRGWVISDFDELPCFDILKNRDLVTIFLPQSENRFTHRIIKCGQIDDVPSFSVLIRYLRHETVVGPF